jgi:TIR domain
MPYIPGFDNDIFLSYASDDNGEGAVAEFVDAMRKEISSSLVNCRSPEKVRIYFDRQQLASQTGVNWKEELQGAASSSALLVPLLSANYLSSDSCRKEREWFARQPHVENGRPFCVVGWKQVGQDQVPTEFAMAERHPDDGSWLAAASPEERLKSAKAFGGKLSDRLLEMRRSVSTVFLGPAAELNLETRKRVRDELEKSGYRVVPETEFDYKNEDKVRTLLKDSLVAIHFPGGGLDLEGLRAMEESFRLAEKTLLVKPYGSTLSQDEKEVVEDGARTGNGERLSGPLEGKTDDQVWTIVSEEVKRARFRKKQSEYEVGIACDRWDIAGAKAVAVVITQQRLRARYPAFDAAVSAPDRVAAMRNLLTQSKALLCYWATGDGKYLRQQIENAARSRYQAKAWYLAPPLDLPGKEELGQSGERVLRQKTAEPDLPTLAEFLKELGWEPPK